MVQIFAFNELAILVRHWYEVGEHDEEHGARLEVRRLRRHPHRGSGGSAQVIELDDLLWRVDLFDLVGQPAGNMERAHHHLEIVDNEPPDRDWDPELSRDPFGWTQRQLEDLDGLLTKLDVEIDGVRAEAMDLHRALPAIMSAARAYAGERCASPQECLTSTRDTGGAVQMMLRDLRGDAHDPRVIE